MMTIRKMTVTDLRQRIEGERQRLKELRQTKSGWWNSTSSDWARQAFGEDLDGDINNEILRLEGEGCQICDKDFPLDERFIRLDFSFCDEYDCDMNICSKCLTSMGKRLRNE